MSKKYGSDLDDYGFERYEENPFPIAYLLTFGTYGTWLHGDKRTSIQRSRDKRFRTIKLDANVPLNEKMKHSLKGSPMILNHEQRAVVEAAIHETCEFRNYLLRALNVRTNHAHAVVSGPVNPEKIVNDLKAYATRRLREAGLVNRDQKVWARGASTRYLWKPQFVIAAVDYVLYSQGDVPFDVVCETPRDF